MRCTEGAVESECRPSIAAAFSGPVIILEQSGKMS